MIKRSPDDTKALSDIRVAYITKIWGMAVGILPLCLPLAAITRSRVILLAVISGATLGTFAIWRTDDQKSSVPMQLLEPRIAN